MAGDVNINSFWPAEMNWMGDLGIIGCQIALLRKHMMSSGCSGKSHYQKHVSHLLQGIFSLLPPKPGEGNTTSVINLFSCVGTEKPSTNKILSLCFSLFSPIYFPLMQYASLQMRKSAKATGVEEKKCFRSSSPRSLECFTEMWSKYIQPKCVQLYIILCWCAANEIWMQCLLCCRRSTPSS